MFEISERQGRKERKKKHRFFYYNKRGYLERGGIDLKKEEQATLAGKAALQVFSDCAVLFFLDGCDCRQENDTSQSKTPRNPGLHSLSGLGEPSICTNDTAL